VASQGMKTEELHDEYNIVFVIVKEYIPNGVIDRKNIQF
jgi:hypothetical protein